MAWQGSTLRILYFVFIIYSIGFSSLFNPSLCYRRLLVYSVHGQLYTGCLRLFLAEKEGGEIIQNIFEKNCEIVTYATKYDSCLHFHSSLLFSDSVLYFWLHFQKKLKLKWIDNKEPKKRKRKIRKDIKSVFVFLHSVRFQTEYKCLHERKKMRHFFSHKIKDKRKNLKSIS